MKFSSTLLATLVLSIFCGKSCAQSVIIIGAGASGIAAATKLLENGFTNVTILEAENRIGGRIHSIQMDDGFVDLGAEFCHGLEGNVVYGLVKDLNLLRLNVFDDPPKIYYSNGSRIQGNLVDELQNLVINIDLGEENKTGLSVGELFLRRYNNTLLDKYKSNPEASSMLNEGLPCAETVLNLPEGSFNWFDPSVEKHYQECEGYQLNSWKGRGYKTILDVLMRKIPESNQKMDIDTKIFFNTTVTNIDWSGEIVEVSTSDQKSYEADYVIFTPSVGVLKEQHQKLFSPGLPEVKQKAIEETGFDGVMKIIMHFPKQWWRDEDDFFAFVWSQDDIRDLKNRLGGNFNWVSHINILVRVSDMPKVRIARVAGDVVKEIEVLPLDNLRRGLSFLLNKFLGKDYDVIEPDQIIRSTWYTNPNFKGAYSYEKAKYYKKEVYNQKILADPLRTPDGRPVVLFAGEATNPVHYSTVHGAIETGHREADRLLRIFREEESLLNK